MRFKEIFNFFDINGDGSISHDDLVQILSQYQNLSKERATKETDRIISNIDINQNGAVDFTEFVIGLVSTKDILTDDKLLNAFNMLDMDGNGRITKSDLEAVFKKNSPEGGNSEDVDEIMFEADEKGTGEIGFNEFKKLMLMMQRQPVSNTIAE